MSPEVGWKAKAAAKAASISDTIPESWRIPEPIAADAQTDITGPYLHKYLTGDEIEITEASAVGIVKKVADGEWRAENVARAFCHRAALAHQYVSCLHDVFFDVAIKDAVALDEYYRQHGKPIGPLHGLPVSLKDQMHVKGVETTMGYVGWIGAFQGHKGTGLEKQFKSELVTELRGLGAVLYCKTSVPQTLMSAETMNNIIGYTFNPKNRNLSSGGSSGGEGALISLRGSPIGFGTDYSGSIRMPAAFNGLYGIRPSSGRLPYQGMANSMDGQNTVLSVVGPMSHSHGFITLLSWKYLGDLTLSRLPRIWYPVAKGSPLTCWLYDGGVDVHQSFGLSGEPIAEQIGWIYGSQAREQMNASAIARNNIAKRDYQKDALDWTVVTIPITTVDKDIDSVDSSFSPLSDFDARVQQGYIPEIYDGAHVSLQLLGRRFQEEKLLVLADYIGKTVASYYVSTSVRKK
ncbi:unnamed protein product [Clonostachys rhizophaga]|uniref:Amidase domain-containing protein n=1 Tax=Clonostachys rhizophaga TaxID=160324 RepID=A0A9N9YD06_9HYPO|nr:unnamed protein product [Clonostachys rhizophaga]